MGEAMSLNPCRKTWSALAVALACSAGPSSASTSIPDRPALAFEANRGQSEASVGFLARTGDATVFLTPRECVLAFPAGDGPGRAALRLSLVCSAWATVLSVLFGVPLAWVLARSELPGRGVVRALCTLSMVLPPVVGGVALLFALGRRGIVG